MGETAEVPDGVRQVLAVLESAGVVLDADTMRAIDEALGDLPETDPARTRSPESRPA